MQSEAINQVLLIAELRWRLFRNSLRSGRARAELIAHTVAITVGAAVAVLLGLGLYAASFFLVETGRLVILGGLLWGVFLAWLIVPILVAVSTSTPDFRELLRFPLRFSAYLAMSLAYAFFDPPALMAFFWLMCLAAGVAVARPDAFLWAAPAFAGLAAVSLLLGRIILTALERLLMRRRGRELFFLMFIALIFAVQLLGLSAEEWGKAAAEYLKPYLAWGLGLPPGLVYVAVRAAVHGDPLGALMAAGGLAVYAALFFLLLGRRLRAQYRCEEASEGFSLATVAPVQAGWALPGMPGHLAALIEKEVRYAMRNGLVVVSLAVPLFIPAIIGVVARAGEELPQVFQQDPGSLFLASVAYMFFVLMHLATNHYAFESHGIQFLLAAPASFRDFAAAKNIAYGGAILGLSALIWLILAALWRVPGLVSTLVVVSALPVLLLAQLSVGNLLSLHFPRRFDFGRFKQRQSGMSVLLGLLQQIVTLAVVSGTYGLARWLDRLWLAAVVYLVLGAALWQVYRVVLDHCTELAARNREELTAELCHN
jgi:hypothetical protein